MTELPSMRPTGWFQVAWSTDLAVGDVMPLKYFGLELVAFRDLDGTVSVLDAHCQHLGANLAFGGCVVEGGIRCPFHGWVWSGQGRNVCIPYEDRPNRGRRMRSYPVTELNECIYIWHDLKRRDPLWQVPAALDVLGSHIRSQSYRPLGVDQQELYRGIHVHPQVIAENAVDPHHFRFVHRTSVTPVVLSETTDHATWHAKVGFGKRWADGVDRPGDTANTIEINWSGIGVSFNGEQTRDGVRIIAICATPVDETTSDIRATYWISEGNNYEERLRAAKLALPDDIKIWDHQKYLDQPALAPSEAAGFKHLRSWARSFYPEQAAASI
ncbi:Rieske 2Fe-2S domain-containing protein [[Mycobacterium] zoologicum]|uniref:Rieske 2Fe-2S domain-containing protein n=1 Tax=[Mycobacterium] zoologicum TaxID=2872311 RepID=UPI002C609CDC|nr:Rieske 2Fe-2S domain-containing protein [Mycolicibacter sp. MYC101]MEB3065651.1 Rieske 2Fe-2S domain-containing protein [Mycolicibacter sp. MYC101]